MYFSNKEDEERLSLEEVKMKNIAFWSSPELYNKAYPVQPRNDSVDEQGIEHIVPRDEKELRGIFNDLQALGIPVNKEEEAPKSKAFDRLQKGLQAGRDIDDIDLELDEEVKRMQSAMKVESID